MSAARINLIILLTSIALIGIISLQIYWIRWNIGLNEAQFDKNIFTALNKVADKLQNIEALTILDDMKRETSLPIFGNGYTLKMQDSLNDNSVLETFEDKMTMWEYMKVAQMVDAKPLAERIPLDVLAQSLREELENQGINTPYEYGVFSKSQNGFVIVNDHFAVVDAGPQIAAGSGSPTLFNSKYRVSLFQQDIDPPGYLALYFPNRTGLVWGSVWQTLTLSAIFSLVVLFCFWYTIRIIFRQKQLSEMKNDFINNMTHEFKTPIATISLAADSIANPTILGNPDKIKRFVDIIRQENRRMNGQVERVLQMAMIDKQDFQLKPAQLNIHDLIRQAADNFSLQVEKKEGKINLRLDAELPVVEGDPTHLAGVIHNLLDNANKYSPEKPDIEIATRDVPMGVEISVRDKGIGIGPEARKFIFDKFYRVHTGNVHDVKGFGLGLSYVKAIVTAHKGLIDLKSELGKGSTFIVTLPKTIS